MRNKDSGSYIHSDFVISFSDTSLCATRLTTLVVKHQNRICGVMVSVLVSSVVDRGFEPRSDQTNLVFVVSPLSMQYKGERAKTGWP